MALSKVGLVEPIDSMTVTGTTPTLTVGDAGAEDTKIIFDGNAQDFHIGLDDSTDKLTIGLGSTLGTTTHMSFDETGAVIKPLQPAFSCLQSSAISAQSLTDATAIVINLNSEVYDVNGDASSTGVFTAPVTGKYMISCKCGGDAGSSSNVRFDQVVAQLHTSNRAYYFDSSGTVYSDVNDKVWSGGSVLADMDASDTATLKFYVKRNGATTATTTVQSADSSGLQTFMTGYLAC